jgi:hypothetical protein
LYKDILENLGFVFFWVFLSLFRRLQNSSAMKIALLGSLEIALPRLSGWAGSRQDDTTTLCVVSQKSLKSSIFLGRGTLQPPLFSIQRSTNRQVEQNV